MLTGLSRSHLPVCACWLPVVLQDVHSRYRTEAHADVVGRFNERFLLSLGLCQSCLVVDDELNILPISSHVRKIKKLESEEKEVHSLQMRRVGCDLRFVCQSCAVLRASRDSCLLPVLCVCSVGREGRCVHLGERA